MNIPIRIVHRTVSELSQSIVQIIAFERGRGAFNALVQGERLNSRLRNLALRS